MTILDRIVQQTRARLASEPVDLGALAERAYARPPGPDAWAALNAPGVRIIAEVKRKSPSAGAIRDDADPVAFARAYAAAGAAAISVLTEPAHFGGSLADLEAVAGAVAVPCLRKDFIVDPRQVYEARAAGASLVLLLASVLDEDALVDLRELAEDLGMHALVEAHDEAEVALAVASGAHIIGVNSRDLKTFTIDLAVAERLFARIPHDAVAVAESGIATRADVERLAARGYRAFLVGTSLMRASDPGAALAALLGGDEVGEAGEVTR